MGQAAEKLKYEYDAYAKFENMVTFLISDFTVFRDYMKLNSGPLPVNLIKQFVQDVTEFKVDAEILEKQYGFLQAAEVATMILHEVDRHSHRSLQEMVKSSEVTRLGAALQAWAEADLFSQWQARLSTLAETTLTKMNALLQQISEVA